MALSVRGVPHLSLIFRFSVHIHKSAIFAHEGITVLNALLVLYYCRYVSNDGYDGRRYASIDDDDAADATDDDDVTTRTTATNDAADAKSAANISTDATNAVAAASPTGTK